MLENLYNFICEALTNHYGWFFWLYWPSVIFALIGGVLDAILDYKRDLNERFNMHYTPRLTVGRICGYFFYSFLPIVNTFTAVVTLMGTILSGLIEWLAKVFNKPLVRPLTPEEKDHMKRN